MVDRSHRDVREGFIAMAASEKVHAYLIVAKAGQPDQWIIWDTLQIRIGRHPDQDLVLPESEISREHALLKHKGAQFEIEDLHTANHTYVNGQQITKSQLTPNDVISVGDWKIRFCVSSENPVLRDPRAKYASRLKDYRLSDEEEGARTMLGVKLEEDPALAKRAEKKPYRVENLRKKLEVEEPAHKLDLKNQGIEALGEMSFSADVSGFDFPEDAPTVPVLRSQPDAASALSQARAAQTTPAPVATPQTPTPAPVQMLDSVSDFEFASEEPVVAAPLAAPAPAPVSQNRVAPTASLQDVTLTLQLQGVSAELLQLLESLHDRKLDLRELAIVLQSIAVKK